jgi:hypothetical protein
MPNLIAQMESAWASSIIHLGNAGLEQPPPDEVAECPVTADEIVVGACRYRKLHPRWHEG